MKTGHRRSLLAFSAAAVLAGFSGCSHQAVRAENESKAGDSKASGASWFELAPSGLVARQTTADSACPKITRDGREIAPTTRAEPSEEFPVRVCETTFPISEWQFNRIVVLGDTGCRVKNDNSGAVVQDCNHGGWPFADVAKAAAAWKPDLVVHVGDYLYRENVCPPGNSKCAGSSAGDNWKTWEQDFFAPAEPLLEAAPWIFVRGNHESCKRAGDGFGRLLSTAPYSGKCVEQEAPYALKLGDMNFAVLDSTERDVDAKMIAPVSELGLSNAWLLTHRPLWFVPTAGRRAPSEVGVPKGVSLVLAGHFHEFFAMNFADGRPAQVIGGNGGTKLDEFKIDLTGAKVDGTKISQFHYGTGFGFATLERAGSGWKLSARDRAGTAYLTCQLKEAPRGNLELKNCLSESQYADRTPVTSRKE